MAIALGDAFSEARCEDRGPRGFATLNDEMDVGCQSAERGSTELAMEALRRNLHLQGLVCEASEVWDGVFQCSWRSNVE